MKYDELLNKLTEENNGVLTTKDAVALGVTKPSFLRFVEKNGYERVAHGIYQNPDDWPDDFYVISRRSERAVFSH
ncbi:MAG: type IV toxin-antitoxin system AbiEi family antitoxin domain-containing protein, partial [Synergistaceae bacterium]|nr:type IV toxin-antitoxin system AbiEi family antitoxin domain-containing protein [Synergistaceae bacterium]